MANQPQSQAPVSRPARGTARATPITSYGIILFACMQRGRPPEEAFSSLLEQGGGAAADCKEAPAPARPETLKVLLFQRRDTYEYIEFLRGLWSTETEVLTLLSLMSEAERQRLREYTFDELWDDFWVSPSSRMANSEPRARHKYGAVCDRLGALIAATAAATDEPPWGFPKGRRNQGEDAIHCALREFGEETRVPPQDLYVWRDEKPLVDLFYGSNGKLYSSVYFLAEYRPASANPALPAPGPTPRGIRKTTVSNEAYRTGWHTLASSATKLNPRLYALLRRAYNIAAQKLTA